MGLPAATVSAKSIIKKLLFNPPHSKSPPLRFSTSTAIKATQGTFRSKSKNRNQDNPQQKQKPESLLKRRTRSDKELDEEGFVQQYGNGNSAHVPVLLVEVLDVFASVPLKSFVDCTLGAGGHSAEWKCFEKKIWLRMGKVLNCSLLITLEIIWEDLCVPVLSCSLTCWMIIKNHPEMKLFVGFDVDPVAHEMAQARIRGILHKDSDDLSSNLRTHTYLKNFRNIKSVLHDIDDKLLAHGVHGILMDLGMSSMQVNNGAQGFSVLGDGPLDMRMNPQANLTAEDILNLWPDVEVGRILREYGEESNWHSLQNKIVKARSTGGLHSTRELVDLIKRSTSWSRGGRQGWIKTAKRVIQALRIAVNDELNILKDSIHYCFDALASGGRLAIISFHSLEDRIVKQAFLNIIEEERSLNNNNSLKVVNICNGEKEAWIKQMVKGESASILTKRPITPSESEERLNPRSRSAKLRVIQKA